MAKRKLHTNGNTPKLKTSKPDRTMLTNSQGESYQVFPVGQTTLAAAANKVKREFEDAGKPITPPVILITEVAPGSSPVEFTLHSKSLCVVEDNPEETAERLKKFNSYEENLTAYSKAVDEAQKKVMFIYGLCAVPGREGGITPDENEAWVISMRDFIDIPTDRNDFLYWYVSERVLPTMDDKINLAVHINLMNEMTGLLDSKEFESKVDSARAMFRYQVGEQLASANIGGSAPELREETEPKQLATQPIIPVA